MFFWPYCVHEATSLLENVCWIKISLVGVSFLGYTLHSNFWRDLVTVELTWCVCRQGLNLYDTVLRHIADEIRCRLKPMTPWFDSAAESVADVGNLSNVTAGYGSQNDQGCWIAALRKKNRTVTEKRNQYWSVRLRRQHGRSTGAHWICSPALTSSHTFSHLTI